MSEKAFIPQQLQILAQLLETLPHKTSFKIKAAFYINRRKLKKFISPASDDSVSDQDYPT